MSDENETQEFELVGVEEVPSYGRSSIHKDVLTSFQKQSAFKSVEVKNFPKTSVGYLRDMIRKLGLEITICVRGDKVYLTKAKPVPRKSHKKA